VVSSAARLKRADEVAFQISGLMYAEGEAFRRFVRALMWFTFSRAKSEGFDRNRTIRPFYSLLLPKSSKPGRISPPMEEARTAHRDSQIRSRFV